MSWREPTTATKGATTTVKFKHGMVAPLVALFVGVVGFPLGYAFYLSITDYKLTSHGTPRLVGADNYVATLQRRRLLAGVRHHRARSSCVAVGLELVIGLAHRAVTAEAALGTVISPVRCCWRRCSSRRSPSA